MIVKPVRTNKIIMGTKIWGVLTKHLPAIGEESIVVITSKVVSICEGRVVKNDGSVDKYKLIQEEAQRYIDVHTQWGITLTVKNDTLIASSGIDESNGNGYFILWPKDPMKSAIEIWKFLRKRFATHIGVIITDSHTTPLRWGTSGIGIGWCGFRPLNSYIEKPDIFGRNLHVTQSSVLDGIAASAVVSMGEGNEQTPIAVVSDVPFVTFTDSPPSKKEIAKFHIPLRDDIYAPILTSAPWKKGGAE